MSKVTGISHIKQTNLHTAVYRDEEGNEYEFSIEDFTDFDNGIYDHTITWVEDEPEGIDEDDLINLFYEELPSKK